MTARAKVSALSETQKAGIRAVHAELDRYYKAQIQAAQILAGIDETIRALALPVPSPMWGELRVDHAAVLPQVSALQDAIQGAHYGVLFPSLAGAQLVAEVRADVSRELAEGAPA